MVFIRSRDCVALVLRYPAAGLIGGKECPHLLGNVDYLPTVLELAGLKTPAHIQGRSFAAALGDNGATAPREAIFAMYHKTQSRCVRTARFKLIRHFEAATDFHEVPVRHENCMMRRGSEQVELFDLENDPNEFTNVANRPEHKAVQARLDTLLWEWMEIVRDPILKGPVQSPAYLAAMQDYGQWKNH